VPEVSPAPNSGPEPSLESIRLASDLRMVRIVLWAMWFPIVGMVTTDLLILRGDPDGLRRMLLLRGAFGLGLTHALFAFSRVRTRLEYCSQVSFTAIVSAVCLLIQQWLRPADSVVLARFELLVVVGFYAALPNVLRWQVVAAAILSVGASLTYALRPSNIPMVDILTIIEAFALANAIGWYVSRRRGRLERSEEEAMEREQAARHQLEQTMSELRVLRGVIPICSHCRKIRSEVGDWQQLESYVRDHTDTDFSHGLCPDCLDEHYPTVAEEMRRSPIPPM
jgi:hypothetical protein